VSQELERVRAAWSAPESGTHYAGERWRRRGHAQRDPRRIEALLGRFPARASGRVLDAPCGTGRLQACLAGEGVYVGLDLSPSMLAVSERGARCLGEVERLPFADQAFELVVCCRLLHHLRDPEALARVVRELVRVSADRVLVTYWDARSWPALRSKLRGGGQRDKRIARPRAELAGLFEAAGAEVVGAAYSLRFFSQQSYLLARRARA